jgi:hypothetical protein
MENKINQRQYEPYSLNTPSGNLRFDEFVESFSCYLLESLTGNFDITGNLTVNNGQVLFSDISNDIQIGSNNSVLNSLDSINSGSNCAIVNSNDSFLSGDKNTIIGGSDNQIADSDDAAILFGTQTVISKSTGSAMLADGNSSRAKESVERENCLTIDFNSGLFIKNDTFVEGSLFSTGDFSIFDSDVHINASNSGLFSGDFQILGNAYHTGVLLADFGDLTSSSGDLVNIITGASGLLDEAIDAISGNLKDTGAVLNSVMVKYDTHQTITGPKTFTAITGYSLNIGPSGRTVPTARTSFGNSGDLSFDQEYLYLCTGSSQWARVALSYWP